MIKLLSEIALQGAQKMNKTVDMAHQVGKKEGKKTCQVIIQFVMREHRKEIWRLTKESEICKQMGVCFTEDLTVADKKPLEADPGVIVDM